jgi:hypothetical protein
MQAIVIKIINMVFVSVFFKTAIYTPKNNDYWLPYKKSIYYNKKRLPRVAVFYVGTYI